MTTLPKCPKWRVWVARKDPNLANVLMYTLAQFAFPSGIDGIVDIQKAQTATVDFLRAFGLAVSPQLMDPLCVAREMVRCVIGRTTYVRVKSDAGHGLVVCIALYDGEHLLSVEFPGDQPELSISFNADHETAFRVFCAAGSQQHQYFGFGHAEENLNTLFDLMAWRRDAILQQPA